MPLPLTPRAHVALAAYALSLACPCVPAADPPPTWTLPVRVVATGLPGAHGVREVGRFHAGGPFAADPAFLLATQPGQVLDPMRVLVAVDGNGGMVLSIDPRAGDAVVPPGIARQVSSPGAPVQLYSATGAAYANRVHNAGARTAADGAVASPRYLSINNAFGRPWIANAPGGLGREGTITVTDPDGAPLANAPSDVAGGVFAGRRTPREAVATSMRSGWLARWLDRRANGQLTPGALDAGAFGTALLGASPDGSGFAVFAAVTGDGAVAQVHVREGVDGLAPRGTVGAGAADPGVVGVAFAWTPDRVLYVADARRDGIAALRLGDDGRQFVLRGVEHLASPWLHEPVDLAPAMPEVANPRFASGTTLAAEADLLVANRGDGSILRLARDGRPIARARLRRPDGSEIGPGELRSIAVSSDAQRFWIVARRPRAQADELLEASAFDAHGPYAGELPATPAADAGERPALDGGRLFSQKFTPTTGLGPSFNADACVACHPGGRGASGDESRFARRVAHLDPATGRVLPLSGADSAVAPRRTTAGDAPLPPPREANVVSLRMPLALVAAARIDDIDDAAIEAQAVAKGDGIHGRVHRVVGSDGRTRIGRYGWKADVPTLDAMVAAAFSDEMGVSSALAPRPRPPFEDDGRMARAVASFLRGGPASGPPPAVAAGDLQERAR
ncbi:MAG: hypothetical protein ACTHL8_12275 [Burkholderiaceae bacterium]